MRSKKFTLIEIVVVITVISILLAIVLIKYDDFKKKSVYSAVSSNVKIIQTAVDTYYLKKEKYPTEKEISLENPQLINIDTLVKESLLKKDLDLKKIKSQNYWVDIFGTVWGSTKLNPTSVNVLETDGVRTFEFTLDNNVAKYNIYEVSGYSQKTVSKQDFKIDKPLDRVALADSQDKYYRLVKSVDVITKGKETYRGKYVASNPNSVYLLSIEDQYGLETVPQSLEKNEYFEPLISFEGKKEFEIKADKNMKWIEFYTIEKKPAGSSISYRFKVKDEKGKYGEWSEDFYSLANSKGIIVEVSMKSNDAKEKPSLYDLRVLYEFDNQKIGYLPNLPIIYPADTLNPIDYDNDGSLNEGSTEAPPAGEVVEPDEDSNNPIGSNPKPNDGSGSGGGTAEEDPIGGSNGGSGSGSDNNSGGSGSNPIEEEEVGGGGSGSGKDKEETKPPNTTTPEEEEENGGSSGGGKEKKPVDICPTGYETTTIDSNGNYLGSKKEKQIAYLFTLKENESLSKVDPPVLENGKIINTIIQYSVLNSKDPYVPVTALSDIPSNSCVNIVYELEFTKNLTVKTPPFIEVIDTGFAEEPKEETKPINEWKTVDELKFITTSNNESKVNWIGFEKEDTIPANTKILYKFRYFTDNGTWSKEYDAVSELPQARTVMATAYLQIKISEIGKPEQQEPSVQRMTFIQEDGFKIDYSDYKPIALINPSKNNHSDRMIFSTESNITWDVWSFDPLGYEIVDVEWSGDIRNRYDKAGNYTVEARVKNEKGVWSNKDKWTFTVYEEKPVAVLKGEKAYIKIGEKVNWDKLVFDASYDPDQDGIVERQWEGNIKEVYSIEDVGEIELKLRVKDAEGNWSDWTTQTAYVYDDLLWMNVGPKAYDNVSTTYENIDTRQEIYWLEDLTNRKVTMNLTVLSGSGAVVNILDINGNKLNFTDAITNFTLSELNLSGSLTRREFSFIMPKDAYSIQFINYSQVRLNEISVDISEPLPNEVTDIYVTPFMDSTKLEFNSNGLKTNIYREGLYVISKSDNMYLDSPLHSETTYTYQFEVEDKFGNRSDKIEIPVTTLEYDITFYEESNLKHEATRNFTDLNSRSYVSYNFIDKDPLVYKWKFKENFATLDESENRAISLLLSIGQPLEVTFLNGENEPIEFYYKEGQRIIKTKALSKSFTSSTDQNLIIPKGAEKIKLQPTTNSVNTLLYDIKFNNLKNIVGTLQNVKFTSNFNDIKVSWEKEGDVAMVEVYRDGVYIGSATNGTSIDDKSLSSNTEYTYSFVIHDSYGNIRFTEEYKAETLERDVAFYASTSPEINSALINGFDYIESTRGNYVLTTIDSKAEINWKPKKGFDFPANLKGQVIRIYARSYEKDAIYAKVVDKNGNYLPFHFVNTSTIMEPVSEFVLNDTLSYFTIVLPEGANGIQFFRNPNLPDSNMSTLDLGDIRFVELGTMADEITNIKAVPSYNSIVLSWIKPSNVVYTDIYRDGIYVGRSTNNNYTDSSLKDNQEYEYSFIVRKSGHVSKWINPIVTSTLERDISFYSNSELPNLDGFLKAFDYNSNTVESIILNKEDSFEVNWTMKKNISYPDNLKGRAIRFSVGTSVVNEIAFRVVDKNGETLPFHQHINGKTIEFTEQLLTSKSSYLFYVILPEGANGIEFYHVGTKENINLLFYDIQFNDFGRELDLISNVKATPSYNSMVLSWTKPSNVSYIEIYRDGEYIGGTKLNNFADNSILEANKEYNYSFIVRNDYYTTKWLDEPLKVKTLERDISFYGTHNMGSEIEHELIKAFDYNTSTGSTIPMSKTDSMEVNWTIKEDYNKFPTSLKGRVIRVYASSKISGGNLFEIVDKEGNSLPFHQILNSKLTPSNSVLITNSLAYYTIVLPEGANGVKFKRTDTISNDFIDLSIYDIQFIGIETEPDLITEIVVTPSYDNATINWNKPANVSIIDIYRDGEYIGNSNTLSYLDKDILLPERTYSYSFAIRNSSNVTKWIDSIQTTLLEKDITFYSTNSQELTDLMYKSFDTSNASHSTYDFSDGDLNVTWRVKEGVSFPENLKGKVIRVRANATYNNTVNLNVVDKHGNLLDFHYVDGILLKEATKLPMTTVATTYDIVLPEGFAGIKFSVDPDSNNNSNVKLNYYLTEFHKLDTEADLLSNLKVKASHNIVDFSWTVSANVSKVDVYRDGVYLGQSTTGRYQDTSILKQNHQYEYSFVIRNPYNVTKWMEPIQVTTLEKDITFYSKQETRVDDEFLRANDEYGSTTYSTIPMQINDSIIINWKTKEGYQLPSSLKGRVLEFTGYATRSLDQLLKVVDKDGNELHYHQLTGGRTVEKESISLTSANNTYNIILPEGAAGIKFSRSGISTQNETNLFISDLKFIDIQSEFDSISNIKATPTKSNVSFAFDKPSDVYVIEVYRDGVFVSTIFSNGFNDHNRLTPDTEYTYTFVVRNASGYTKWTEPITVRTLAQ